MTITVKILINYTALLIVLTLSLYHLFIFFGRYNFKKERYNLYFSLLGFSISSTIYSFTFLQPGIWNIFFINLFISINVILVIKTISQVIVFNKIGKILNFISYILIIFSFSLVVPII